MRLLPNSGGITRILMTRVRKIHRPKSLPSRKPPLPNRRANPNNKNRKRNRKRKRKKKKKKLRLSAPKLFP